MCGIFACLGAKDGAKACIEGLKKLEYRGYHSAGIAGITKSGIEITKEIGKVSCLEKKLSEIYI